ncbi:MULTISPECIES: hypothetical protein [unclassified Isoptericola]|uniref:hypothetical protein n=1 Tax=unclassified Isoptericola TaxID=2623355 RepID=UPI00364D099B
MTSHPHADGEGPGPTEDSAPWTAAGIEHRALTIDSPSAELVDAFRWAIWQVRRLSSAPAGSRPDDALLPEGADVARLHAGVLPAPGAEAERSLARSPREVGEPHDGEDARYRGTMLALLDRAAHLYRWTGDPAPAGDPELWDRLAAPLQRLMERSDHQRAPLVEHADEIASTFRAFLALAELASARGDVPLAEQLTARARHLQGHVAREWSATRDVWPFLVDRRSSLPARPGDGCTPGASLASAGLLPPDDPRTREVLACLDADDVPPGTAAATALVDTLYRHGQDEGAWAWLQYVISELDEPDPVLPNRTNGEDPATSHALLTSIVSGVAGIEPDAAHDAVTVRSHLPACLAWLELDHVTVGDHVMTVRHDGRASTRVTHRSGANSLVTTIEFAGSWAAVSVDGHLHQVHHRRDDGHAVTGVTLRLRPGQSVSALAVVASDLTVLADTVRTPPRDIHLTRPAASAEPSTTWTDLTWPTSRDADTYQVAIAQRSDLTDAVPSMR